MRKTAKITSLLLTMLMLLALVCTMSINVSASTETQSNEYVGYYKIGNAGQLAWFACLVVGDTSQAGITAAQPDAKAVLTADIDLSDLATRFGKSWSGIGTEAIPFTGIFDGNGYTVRGLTIDTSADSALTRPSVSTIPNTTTEQGLFGVIGTGGVVRNLVLEGTASVADTQKLGAVCSENNGTVENVLAKVTVDGGITPSAFCHTNNGTITNSYTAQGNAAGVTAVDAAALANGSVAFALGAKFGQTLGTDTQPVHHDGENTVYRVFACDGETAVYRNVNENESHSTGAQGDIAPTCRTQGYCSVCKSEYGLDSSVHEGEPVNGFYTCCDAHQPAVQKGFGANGAPLYEISNAGQLYWFAALVNTGAQIAGADTPSDSSDDLYTYHLNARLTANITVNPGSFDKNGSYTPANGETERGWVSIGNINYSGDFDGNYKTVSGLYQSGSGPSGVGFIGNAKEGHVLRNLGITNSVFTNGGYTGAFYAYQAGGKLQNCWTDAIVRGSDSMKWGIGGFAGNLYGTVENSFFFGVLLTSAGEAMNHPYGICGNEPAEGSMINSYSTLGEGAWKLDSAALASGELAVLLANGDARSIWGQTLGTDAHPVFLGPAVYANVPFNCTAVGYSNSPVGSTAHVPATAWSTDGTNHWHACTVEGCDERLDVLSHIYEHACDAVCNICEATRTTAHAYDNACDSACNICNTVRVTAHVYDNDCDNACNVCSVARTVGAHLDDDENELCDRCNAKVPKPGLSAGAGIGIGAGGAAFFLLGGFSLFWFVIRKKTWSDLVTAFKK